MSPTITLTNTISPTPNIKIALSKNVVNITNGETLIIGINTLAGTHVDVKVYNLTGEFLRRYEFDTTINGWTNIVWDMKNNAGEYIGRGMYFIWIKSERDAAVIRRVFVTK